MKGRTKRQFTSTLMLHNKMPQAEWLEQQKFTFRSSEGWKSKIKVLTELVSMRPLSLAYDGQLLPMSPHGLISVYEYSWCSSFYLL